MYTFSPSFICISAKCSLYMCLSVNMKLICNMEDFDLCLIQMNNLFVIYYFFSYIQKISKMKISDQFNKKYM